MAKRLKPQDEHAVDLLLNKAGVTMQKDSRYAAPTNDEQRASVERVEALLALVHEWPADEPPMDLVERTMARIAAATPHDAASQEAHQAAPRLHDPNGPVA